MHWTKYVGIVLVVVSIGCEQKSAPIIQTSRTEIDQQVLKLREDNETEFRDLRGRWLAAEAQLIQLKKALETVRSEQSREIRSVREAVQLLDTEMMASRNSVGTPGTTKLPSSTYLVSEEVRLRRSAEEIICLRRRGADEDVADVYSRYGFADESEWSFAWATRLQETDFDADLFARVDTLCPKQPASEVATPSSE